MKIKQYDRVLLTDGNEASIVEIFEEDKLFLADIDKDGDTYTEEVSVDKIKEIIHVTTHKRIYGKTPRGGDYSEIFYFDENRNPTDEKSATSFVIRECLANGEMIGETWGNTPHSNENEKTSLAKSAMPIDELKLNWKITRKLRKSGIRFINLLVSKTEGELWNDCGLSRLEIDEINCQLLSMGLTLKSCNDDLQYLTLEDEFICRENDNLNWNVIYQYMQLSDEELDNMIENEIKASKSMYINSTTDEKTSL